jgi:aminotransferase
MGTVTAQLRLSQIAPRLEQSEIRAMTMECDRVGGVNLAQGVCDTELPAVVAEGAMQAIRDGNNIYTRLDGIASLREAIAEKLARDNGLIVDPGSEVLVASGATGGFYAALLALLDPGDEVVLFEPFYGYHLNTLTSLRIRPVTVPLALGDWALDLDRLRAAITPRTRALVVNSPSNPCGKVFSRAELEAIAAIAEEHDLFVFTDEIYEYFVYDGTEHISFATLPGMAERTISVSGLSKTFSITGWRIGYLTASARWLPTIAYFHDLTYVCAPSPFQFGAAEGLLRLPASFYRDLANEYQAKRDMLCNALLAAGLRPYIPSGAYYVLADVSSLPGGTAKEKARTLLRERGVAAVAGSAFFGPGQDGGRDAGRGENLLRFCFAKRDAELERACNLLQGGY